MVSRLVGALAVGVLAIALGGCGIGHRLLPKDQRDYYRFDPTFTVEDPQFIRSLKGMGYGMAEGNTAELLENGDEIFPAMLEDIREAKVSINLETYIIKPDEAGWLIANALMEAAGRGVEVRLLVDGWGSWLGGMRKPLEEAGVICAIYRPLRPWTLIRIANRTHRKLLIVDGRIGHTGGLGIDKRWLGDARDPSEWRETQVRVVGPIVTQMQAIFGENWTFATGKILAGDAFYPEPEIVGTVQAQAVKASRGDPSSLPKKMYYMAIQSARKSIHIQNAYFLPDKQIRDALIEAAQRGVDVQVMVPGAQIDFPPVRLLSRLRYGRMLSNGVRIFEYSPTMLHNKTFVVDGVFSTVGSINFDARSMRKNAEASLLFYDHGFARDMEAMFQRDLKRCKEVTYEKWKRRGLPTRITERISWIWEPYY